MKKTPFPLFQSHLDLAHFWWERIVAKESIVIDATCGNGHDTLFLERLNPKKLFAIDLQKEAIEATKKQAKIATILQMSHDTFPESIEKESVTLIVYNLGYLPGGNKSLTTKTETTITSLNAAIELIKRGGLISVTCYPGHAEGKSEEKAVLDWAETLDPRTWSVCYHTLINREKAPSLFLVQRSA